MNKIEAILNKKYSEYVLTGKKMVEKTIIGFSKECYIPETHLYTKEILSDLESAGFGLPELKESIHKYIPANYAVASNENNFIMLILIKLALDRGSEKEANLFAYILGIRFFAIVFYKYIKFCHQKTFSFALSKLKSTHLFLKHGSIPNAILHITQTTLDKRKQTIQNFEEIQIIKVLVEIWHRINQSVKSFANAYYESYKESKMLEVTDEEFSSINSSKKVLVDYIITNKLFGIDEEVLVYVQKNSPIKSTIIKIILSSIVAKERTNIQDFYYLLFSFSNDKFLSIKNSDEAMEFTIEALKDRNEHSIRSVLWKIYESSIDGKYYPKDASDTTKRFVIIAVAQYFTLLALKSKNNFDPTFKVNKVRKILF